jgi:ElaB/YqjD/DUF883 family membrane-anchored ribosome-binding protein
MNANTTTNPAATTLPNGAAPSEMSKLLADIEEVLARAGHVVDADVTSLRDNLREKISMARSGLVNGGRRLTAAAGSAAGATDDYVRGSPWQAVGIAALAGAAVGYALAKR